MSPDQREALYVAASELARVRIAIGALGQVTSEDIRELHLLLRGLEERLQQRVESLMDY